MIKNNNKESIWDFDKNIFYMVKQEINFSYLKIGLEILRVNISQETNQQQPCSAMQFIISTNAADKAYWRRAQYFHCKGVRYSNTNK